MKLYLLLLSKLEQKLVHHLETLPVNNGRTRLVIFLLGDPHLLESGQRSQDGSSDPDGVFPLWRSDDLDLHRLWGQVGQFLLHTVGNAWNEKK